LNQRELANDSAEISNSHPGATGLVEASLRGFHLRGQERALSIEFQCSECNTMLRVDDKNRGKMARCPKCGMINPIPGDAPVSATPTPSRELPGTTHLPSEDLWSMRSVDGTVYGPARWDEIQRWYAEGRINHQCYLQKAGDSQWTPALDVLTPRRTAATSSPSVFSEPQAEIQYQGEVRRGYRPHNGSLIVVLACIGIVIVPCAIIAAIMGHLELKQIRRGIIDPSGESIVQTGYVLGILFSVIGIIAWVCCCRCAGLRVW
jgi:hypothetical protein